MRFRLLAAALALVSPVFAQSSLPPIGFNGNVLHPGIPSSGPPRGPGPSRGPGAASRNPGRRTFGRAVFVPYPVYPAGFDGYYDAPPAAYDPAYDGPTPTVIINQDFQPDTVRPQFRDYSNTPLPEPGTVRVPPGAPAAAPQAPQPAPALADDQPTIFLIAMQDHTILPVIAYWVQGDTLHYISVKGDPNQVSVSLVDRDFSKQLNAERHVPFALPAAR